MKFPPFHQMPLSQAETIGLRFRMMSQKRDMKKERRLFLLVNFINV